MSALRATALSAAFNGQIWRGSPSSGAVRLDEAGHGRVGSGQAWQGLMISALSPSGLSAGFFGIQMRQGRFQRDMAWRDRLRRVKSGQALQTAALGATAPTAALFGEQIWSGQLRPARVRSVEARLD